MNKRHLKQLKKIVDYYIERGYKPRGDDWKEGYRLEFYDGWISAWVWTDENNKEDLEPIDMDGYHWLFSKDSGFMEFVEWDFEKTRDFSFDIFSGHPSLRAYVNMCDKTQEGKLKYFLKNVKKKVRWSYKGK